MKNEEQQAIDEQRQQAARAHAIDAVCPRNGVPYTVYEINMVKMLTEFAERVLAYTDNHQEVVQQLAPTEKDFGTLWLAIEHRDIMDHYDKVIIYGVFQTKDQALKVLRVAERFPSADIRDCGSIVEIYLDCGRCCASVHSLNLGTTDQYIAV